MFSTGAISGNGWHFFLWNCRRNTPKNPYFQRKKAGIQNWLARLKSIITHHSLTALKQKVTDKKQTINHQPSTITVPLRVHNIHCYIILNTISLLYTIKYDKEESILGFWNSDD
jgi:hypothetical protein